jgi:hypothetical protein
VPSMSTLAETVLIDAAIDSYVEWRERAAAVRSAYRRWRDALPRDRPGAFASYAARLDEEELAGDLPAAVLSSYASVRLCGP